MSQRTLGVLSPFLGGYYFGRVIDGIHHAAQAHNSRVVAIQTASINVPNANNSFQMPFGWSYIDGWICIIDAVPAEYLAALRNLGKPVVTVSIRTAGLPAVMADNCGGAYAAVSHLIAHGHSKLGFLGIMSHHDVQQRYQGYRQALQDHGLAFDPTLVYESGFNAEIFDDRFVGYLEGRNRPPFSGLFCGMDLNALDVMRRFKEVGLALPGDVAVVGFDDIDLAEAFNPPLTTVRQQVAQLGSAAAELVLSQLDGAPAPGEPLYVPTTLIIRRSCGCTAADQAAQAPQLQLESVDQRQRCAYEMVMLAIEPQPITQGSTPESVWPGVTTLIDAVEAVVRGGEPPAEERIAAAWEQVLALTSHIEPLLAGINRLRQYARDLRAGAPHDPALEPTLGALYDHLIAHAVRAHVAQEKAHRKALEQMFRGNYEISMQMLLGEQAEVLQNLSWLASTALRWGCMAIYRGAPEQQELIVAGVYSPEGHPLAVAGAHVWAQRFPRLEWLPESILESNRDIISIIPILTVERNWGVLTLVGGIDTQGQDDRVETMGQIAALLSTSLERAELQAKLEAARHAAEEANRLKSQFLASMSHELRTPLNSIINFTDFLGDADIGGALNDRQQALQQRVLVNAEHLLGLINDLLDLAKIESGKMELQCEQLNLVPILQGVMTTAGSLVKEKALALQLVLPEELPPVWADKTRVRQILLNLLSNAAKFTVQGGITVRAEVVGDGSHEQVQIAVQDTGIGIPPEKQHLVFEEFRQVDSELSHVSTGTGLGMPISRKFVELHGGRMWLESAPGQGSTFFFTLPLRPPMSGADEQPAAVAEAHAALLEQASPAQGAAAPLVLVVDDNPDDQRILRELIERAGYRAHAVLNSALALQEIRERQPAMVLLDIEMSPPNGWAVLDQIRAEPGLEQLPVVICSVIDRDQQVMGVISNIRGHITKPIRQQELHGLIRELMPQKHVLIVDDDPDARMVLRSLLEQQGHQTSEATSGRRALEALRQMQPSLILLDLMMPEMDGFEVLAQLRDMPEAQAIPVIVITAKDLSDEERALLQRYPIRYFQKPMDTSDFVRLLERMVGVPDA